METCISELALFYKTEDQRLIGICASYVDDSLHAENVGYANFTKKLS